MDCLFNSIFHHNTCHGVLGLPHPSIHSFIEKQLTHYTHSPPLAHSLVSFLPSSFSFLPSASLIFLFLFLFLFLPSASSLFPPNIRTPPSLSRHNPTTPHFENKTKTRPESASEQMSYCKQDRTQAGSGLGSGSSSRDRQYGTMDVYIYSTTSPLQHSIAQTSSVTNKVGHKRERESHSSPFFARRDGTGWGLSALISVCCI